jgi:agmatinase
VYFTLDLDVLDPSILPGTGTPEAGGLSFSEMMDAIKLLSQLNIAGFDMVELSPIYDQSGASTALACKLLRELLIAFASY